MPGINQQPIHKQDLRCNGSAKNPYSITEVFETIQGEGIYAGRPALFIRLAGCNLRCFYCDTKYPFSYTANVLELVKEYKSAVADLVVITGGEPFRQNISVLVSSLYAAGATVQIETNGTLSLPCFPWKKATVICSPKTGKIHKDIEEHAAMFRYTLRGEVSEDGLPNESTATEGKEKYLYRASRDIWVSPCDEGNSFANSMNLNMAVDIARRHNYRLGIQLHKILRLP